MKFDTVRVVQRNYGGGYDDFYELQTRRWWFPFWTINCWSSDKGTIYTKWYKMKNNPAKFIVLESE